MVGRVLIEWVSEWVKVLQGVDRGVFAEVYVVGDLSIDLSEIG